MGTIFTQVNNGTFKTYIQGESREIFRNSRDLIERAKAKGFKLTQKRKQVIVVLVLPTLAMATKFSFKSVIPNLK